MPYFLYNTIPGTHPTWTLAVLATSQRDADTYMKREHHGGKRAGTVKEGNVDAHCGAVTPAMQERLAAEMRKETQEMQQEAQS